MGALRTNDKIRSTLGNLRAAFQVFAASLHTRSSAMSKRPATDAPSSSSKVVRNGPTRESAIETDEMGEFEDAWEDEIEDDEVMGEEGGNDGTGLFSLLGPPYVRTIYNPMPLYRYV